ncbi:MAG: hypothetical protein MUP09_10890 [Thiovulaceae bacterium]|nr:hypothetical protein [Sulfurimonadaceae bacterium]
MKLLLLLMLISVAVCSAEPISQTIDEILENSSHAAQIEMPSYDPFARVKPLLIKKMGKRAGTKVARPLHLVALLNNRAFINGQWYEKSDRLRGGRVVEVTQESATIAFGKKRTVLFLQKKENILETSKKDAQ